MLKTLYVSLVWIAIGTPVFSQPMNFSAFSCQPQSGSPIFIYLGFRDGAATWQVNGTTVAFQENRSGRGGHEAILSDLKSSTMILLGEDDGRVLFSGLHEGSTVDGECIEVTNEFLAALEAIVPSLTLQLEAVLDEVARSEAEARKRISSLETQIEDLTGQLQDSPNRIVELKGDLNICRASNQTLKSTLDEEVEKNSELEGEIGRLSRSRDTLRIWLQEIQERPECN